LNDKQRGLELKDYQNIQTAQMIVGFYHLATISTLGLAIYKIIERITE